MKKIKPELLSVLLFLARYKSVDSEYKQHDLIKLVLYKHAVHCLQYIQYSELATNLDHLNTTTTIIVGHHLNLYTIKPPPNNHRLSTTATILGSGEWSLHTV